MDLLILHFQRAIYFPPLQNFLNTLYKRKRRFKCITTGEGFKARYLGELIFSKYNHLSFNFSSIFYLLKYRPKEIVYFDSYSSLPVFFYLLLLGYFKKINIYIHYHEYETIEERNSVSNYYRLINLIESSYILPKAKWISHTNFDRLKLFFNDYPSLNTSVGRVIQNLPSEDWAKFRNSNSVIHFHDIKRIIYVGSLGIKSNFIREFIEFRKKKNSNFILDIFSNNIESQVIEIFAKQPWIQIYPSVNYSDLPQLLKDYDCGLILYSGFSRNHVYSIPNKFYEYVSSGLSILTTNRLITLNNFLAKERIPFIDLDYNFRFIPNVDVKLDSAEGELSELINQTQNLG